MVLNRNAVAGYILSAGNWQETLPRKSRSRKNKKRAANGAFEAVDKVGFATFSTALREAEPGARRLSRRQRLSNPGFAGFVISLKRAANGAFEAVDKVGFAYV